MIKKILPKLKKIRFDLIFFYLFLFTIPLQKRHIFNLETAVTGGFFNEWQAVAIYLSDILFGLCILFWIIRLIANRSSLHHDQRSKTDKIYKIILSLVGLFFIICLVSFFINYSSYIDPNIGIYKIIKLAEFILLFIFVIKNINTKKTIITTGLIIVLAGIFQAMIAIGQYLLQQSLMLKSLGEPMILPVLPNVAKIVLDNGKVLIRAYGTFPHPNVLAGFLIVSMLFTIAIIFYKCRDFALDKPKTRLLTILLSFGLIIQFIAFVFTFSRTAWLAFIISLVIFFILTRKSFPKIFKNISSNKFYHPLLIIILAIIFIIISQWPQITSRASIEDQHGDRAISNRVFYNQISFNMIKKAPFLGIGYGNFTPQMENFTEQQIEWWQYQPAHNIYLLIASETGIIGLLTFICFLFTIFYLLFSFAWSLSTVDGGFPACIVDFQ